MSMEDLMEGGDMSTIEVLNVDEVIGSLGREAVDPNAKTVLLDRRPDQLEHLADQLEALCDQPARAERPLAPVA
ncbi:MAG: hypothetical protein R3236_10435 [Phycisphaeraceae bacterium]|nr:hypothetical protein [Phycisphaeraceae bacterium]